jgi:hypothetical protein
VFHQQRCMITLILYPVHTYIRCLLSKRIYGNNNNKCVIKMTTAQDMNGTILRTSSFLIIRRSSSTFPKSELFSCARRTKYGSTS